MAEAYDVVAVEDIDMKAMSQCMHFGKSVMDNSYGKFRELLEYKRDMERQEIGTCRPFSLPVKML
ncbi:MAG: hypothetical protein ACLTDC_12055 [Lachnospiraceae bacterium]